MLQRNCLASVLFIVAGVCAASAAELAVPITVEEPNGVARVAAPVSGGIPLPEGQFVEGQTFGLFDGDRAVPLQALPLVTNGKGGLRWLLLDFQTDLKPKEKKTFTLKAVAPALPPAGPPVKPMVTDTATEVTVDTGRIVFRIAKDKPFSLFSAVAAGGRDVTAGGAVSYVDGFDGKRYAADKPASVTVEYAGPLRTTICAKGRFVGDDKNRFQYVARVTAWAGRSDVHVKYSLANSNPDHYSYRKVKESVVELALAAKPDATIVGAGKPLDAGSEAWLHQSSRVFSAATHSSDSLGDSPWFHRTPGASEPGGAKAMNGDKDLWTSQGKSDMSEGWLAARSGDATVWVTDLYFVEDPPRRLAVANGKLLLVGVTEPLEGAKSPFSDRTRLLFDCSHLSSQYIIDFAAPRDPAALSGMAKAARGRLWAMAAPSWYSETEQLPIGRFGSQEDELKCYDLWGWKYDAKEIPTKPAGKAAGIGRWSCGDDNHFTSEQDTVDALLPMYLRTGQRAFFDATECWVNYFMDLQTWRTDGWRWKDGAGWWAKRGKGGPLGNRPERAADPVTGERNYILGAYAGKPPFGAAAAGDMFFLANAKACYCHNWGEGMVEWFCITGDRDAYEAVIDTVEQNLDAHRRSFGREPGKASGYSRDFTRASFLTHAARLIAPNDPFVVEASDFLANVYLKRPNPEPRGLLNGPSQVNLAAIRDATGANGLARMKELGVTCDEAKGELVDPKSGAHWMPVQNPHTWMFPPLSRAMDLYYRITGNEDALDWMIAYGEAVAHVLYQEKHGTLNYSYMMVDFPVKGFAWDRTSWELPAGAKDAKGLTIPGFSGYQASFHPDIPARAYEYCGEPLLKQRAFDLWCFASHPGIFDRAAINRVGKWINIYSTHDESVSFSTRMFYVGAHPRQDEKAPAAIADLAVTVDAAKATVTFTAPTDVGGSVARYQVKCADKPFVDYETFLKKYAANEESGAINWWMGANLAGEPGPGGAAPKAAGAKESFVVSGVPANAKYFAVRSFDGSWNRSPLSNLAIAKP